MTTSSFAVVSSVFGFITTVISLLALVFKTCRSHLPSGKIQVLEALLDDTEQLFRNAVEEGLLMEPGFVQETELRIGRLKTRTYELRSRVHEATSLRQDYAELFRGTSAAIGDACQSLKMVKAQIVTSCEQGHYKPMGVNAVLPNPLPPALLSSLHSRHHLDGMPTSQVPCSPKCPPALLMSKSLGIHADKDPSSDSVQSGLDVQTTDVQDCTSVIHTSVTLERLSLDCGSQDSQ